MQITRILKKSQPRILFFSSSLNMLGSWIRVSAYMSFFADKNSLALFGTLMLVKQIIELFLQPVAGWLADHFNGNKLLLFSQIFCSCLGAVITCLLYSQSSSLITIVVLSSLSSLSSIIFSATQMSIIPKIVNNNDLPTFNSLMGSVSTLSLIFGPALGGLVMFFGGAAEVLLFDTLLFIISSIIISRLNKISDDLTPQKLRLTSLRSLLSGFKFIKESKLVFSLVFYAMLSNMGVAVTWILTPLIVKNLSLSSNYVGYVMSAIGLGSFIGMNLGPKIQVKYYHLACTINTLLFTIILFFWSHYSTSINRVFALAFLMGFFACLHEASFWTLLQRKTPKALFGRVFTSVDSLSVIGMIIGTFVTERFFNFNTNFSLLPFLIMIILWTVGSLTFFFARTKKIIEV